MVWTRLGMSIRLDGTADGIALRPTDAADREIRILVDGSTAGTPSLTLDGRHLDGTSTDSASATRLSWPKGRTGWRPA